MSTLDPFAAQLVDMVRQMPDETLLELIRYQLAVPGEAVAEAPAPAAPAAPKPAAKPRAKAKAKPKAKAKAKAKAEAKVDAKVEAKPAPAKAKAKAKPKAKAKAKGGEPAGEEFLASVEKLVNSSNGVAVADIAKGLSVPKSRAASAVRQLKQAKRIFQGGDRRFARYASSLDKAKAASDRARGKA